MTGPQDIAASIAALYPEIARHGIDVAVADDPATGEWLVTMRHGAHSLSTHLGKADAEACLRGVQCAALGIQIGRFVENYCLGQGECPA
ncbi:MAG: hypothetical protein AAGU21_13080 [Solidesulfovibrio sp.]|uniref:hypothetical protein n=1 Tax=Solidesulfovibrio sp. TaxID=2910990 RepID=UPI002B208ECD|nr:hypothetical protein [Solidesulfovibrio sp.]MEA4855119.1 hypothetical protein [Solidesulfovibrio sp.]